MKTELVNITPVMARRFLMHNSNNRTIRKTHVESLSLAFKRGEAVTTHQGIAFDTDGSLLDGQHRLTAIAQQSADFSFPMLVTTGLNRASAFSAIDVVQVKRTTADALRIDKGLAQAANFLARLHAGTGLGITPGLVSPFVEYIRREMIDLLSYAPSAIRLWSSAPVRAAAVMSIKIHLDNDYTKLVYKSLLGGDYESMPNIARVMFQAHINGRLKASSPHDVFARSLKVFDPANDDLKILKIGDLSKAILFIREFLNDDLFGHSGNKNPPRSK